jgi:hypothetical protein
MSCKDFKEKDSSLYEGISSLENKMTKEELDYFRNTDEKRPYFGKKNRFLNKYINEVFIKNDSSLIKYFHTKKIYRYGDMSDVVFVSLHRKLNSKDINLEQQINDKIDYWKSLEDCKKNQKETLKKNDVFIRGDTVQIRMKISSRDNCAYPIDCLNMEKDWKFDDKKDLLIKGVVIAKYSFESIPENVFMKIKIIDLNKKNIPAPRKLLKIGDDFEIVLNYDIIEFSHSSNSSKKQKVY